MTSNPSLLDLFSPPQTKSNGNSGWHGDRAILCGYSADESFMESALLNFTGADGSLRRKSRRFFMTLALDYHEKNELSDGGPSTAETLRRLRQVAGLEVAGCRLAEKDKPRFREFSLHAKVAVLRFEQGGHWLLRLIVSTGNWTRTTVRDSIDLFWCCDLDSEELESEESTQSIADLNAAKAFFTDLAEEYPQLDQKNLSTAVTIENTFSGLPVARGGLPEPRFMHSFKEPLWPQILKRAQTHLDGCDPNNLLYLGSGFYQQSGQSGRNVVDKILADLCDCSSKPALLVSNAKRHLHLYVNPKEAGFIAGEHKRLAKDGWKILPAPDPFGSRDPRQFLHAKFIYCARFSNRRAILEQGWLYLGSGNLTPRGLTTEGGNIEAGVFETPEMVPTAESKRHSNLSVLTQMLPVLEPADAKHDTPEFAVSSGAEEGDNGQHPLLPACPVVRVLAAGDRLTPVFLSEDTQQVWIQIGDEKLSFSPSKGVAIKEELPATVKIFWRIENGQECCQDVYVERAESGCLIEFELRKTFDDIGALLSRLASGESELDEDEEEAFADEANARIQAAASSMTDAVQDTPIRRMMRFICEIGRSQSRVSEGHWDEFRKLLLAHLTALAQEAAKGGTSSEAHCLRYFASDLKLNPFAYLVEVSGYKPFWLRDESQAESNQDWALYKESLNRIFSMCREEKIHGVQ